MHAHPIAVATAEANAQHYEVPADFFATVLGPRRKYSCCLYADAASTLAEAEALALAETAAHAGLADGQHILELGCGWGSLSLWMAEHFPQSGITAVSNSHSQRAHIEAQATARGLSNLRVITADMNAFQPEARFDRIVSVEMFEHMSNWEALLRRIHTWLKPDGALFLHVFSHTTQPYRFDTADKSDWIAQHFFTGGIMPSHNMLVRPALRPHRE
jgi:cyclopropane-fatty-acyl-phospholipid synthase